MWIVTDYDGSLKLRNETFIHCDLLHFLFVAQQTLGLKIVLATGRSYSLLKSELANIAYADIELCPLITELGSRITTPLGEDIAYLPLKKTVIDCLKDTLDREWLKHMLFYPLKGGNGYILYSCQKHEELQFENLFPKDTFCEKFLDLRSFWDKIETLQCTTIRVATLQNLGKIYLPNQVECLYNPKHELWEIVTPGVNKGSTLLLYCKKFDIPLHQIIVVGDGNNDQSLFELTQIPYRILVGQEACLRDLATDVVNCPAELPNLLKKILLSNQVIV